MKAPASRHHDLDIWDPIVQLPYLGEPVADVITVLEADGWEIDLYDDSPIDPNASPRERHRIVTLQARYDYVPVCARKGRVMAIGMSAPFYR